MTPWTRGRLSICQSNQSYVRRAPAWWTIHSLRQSTVYLTTKISPYENDSSIESSISSIDVGLLLRQWNMKELPKFQWPLQMELFVTRLWAKNGHIKQFEKSTIKELPLWNKTNHCDFSIWSNQQWPARSTVPSSKPNRDKGRAPFKPPIIKRKIQIIMFSSFKF